MSRLILIRHSITRQQPEVSSHEWTLTDAGRVRCKILAEELRQYGIASLYCSHETKARLTAGLVAETLKLPAPEVLDGVQETLRHTAPYTKSVAEFQSAIKAAMMQPDELLYGEETFTAARTRFTAAVNGLIQAHPGKTLAVVTHGTILSLYLAHVTGRDVFEIWTALDMPAYAVLALPEMRLEKLVPKIDED